MKWRIYVKYRLPGIEIAEEIIEQSRFSTLHDHAPAVSYDSCHTHPCTKYIEV